MDAQPEDKQVHPPLFPPVCAGCGEVPLVLPTRGDIENELEQMQGPPGKPKWEIDLKLEVLLGKPVRVKADRFAPLGVPHLPLSKELILPDGSTPVGEVIFEGVLKAFERRIGVVYATLDSLSQNHTAEGFTFFRDDFLTIVRGCGNVTLSYPFFVEPLPPEHNYRRDLREPLAQFEFRFEEGRS